MIISRTPLRMSFVGGGSDLSAYYEHESGAVVSTAIDKYIYITVNPKFDRKVRASYSVTEIVDGVDDLKHELIREALKLVGIDGGIEITSISDIPSEGTGLGSSSTYTVGLLEALYAYTGRHVGAERLAREACQIEIERCAKPIGKQDQYIAAYGGLQYLRFNPDQSVYVDPVTCGRQVKQRFQQSLLLFYLGMTRTATMILSEQRTNTAASAAHRAGLKKMVELAEVLRESLLRGDLDAVGPILHEGWLEKKQLASSISSPAIDALYERARRAGAVGGKVLGAGGGGFMLLFASPEHHACIIKALPELRPVPFRFEPQGSKIIYVEDQA
jgi:D-glycero-alpha-D-manno-heptose-7-phosphate kinase